MTDECRVVAVVQARMGSARLPGKSLACLGGQPVVETVLRRVNRAGTVDTVVLATSTLDQDDALSALAGDLGFECVRGSESDVLARVYRAAQTFDADVVVRVCADNPLVAPEEIDRVVKRHVQAGGDYTFNHIPAKGNGYPDGVGAEVLDLRLLADIHERASEQAHREHVTAYVWDNQASFDIVPVQAPDAIADQDIRLDLDTATDYLKLRDLVRHAPSDITEWSAADIVKTYKRQLQ